MTRHTGFCPWTRRSCLTAEGGGGVGSDEGLSTVRVWQKPALGFKAWAGVGGGGYIGGVRLEAGSGGQVMESAWGTVHVGANRSPLI